MAGLTLLQLFFFCCIVVLSYSIRGSAGFGGATVPLLALVLSLKIVVPVVTVLGLISSWSILARDSRHIAWGPLLRIAPWSLLGALAGLYFFAVLDAHTLERWLGVLVIVYGTYSLWRTFHPARGASAHVRFVMPVMGTAAGFVGTLFGAMAGIFYAMYFDMMRFAKSEFRASVAAVLFGLGIVRGTGYFVVGAITHDALVACAAALPLMGIGTWLGHRIHANLEPLAFRRFVALVLALSGVPLLYR